MVKVNCAALPDNLLESEMFGYVKGAFTGADRDKPGRFQEADGGTIFLDEIGDLPLALQAKLLRVLEDMEFYPLGSRRTTKVDVRIIAATNRGLERLVSEKRFREDLFYRINVVPLHLPPLRERMEDLPLLVKTFCQNFFGQNQSASSFISPEVMELFMGYPWPGNIRELKSTIEYASIIAGADRIEIRHLPQQFKHPAAARATPTAQPANKGDINEKTVLLEVLRQCNGNKTKAADILGVHRMTVWNRMKKFGIESRHIIE